VVLSNDRELATLNQAHMGEPGPTDVLSFPLLPPEAFQTEIGRTPDGFVPPPGRFVPPPGRFALPPGRFALPPGRRLHLGDVVISVERATRQARKGQGGQTSDVRWSAADELRLLVTHGVLHICGWDHALPSEEAAMRALERDLLSR
jgi:probable rRNA maturation factor